MITRIEANRYRCLENIGHELLRPFQTSHHRAVVVLDAEWEGSPGKEAIIEHLTRQILATGWQKDAFQVIVIDPELENWIWQQNDHVARGLGFNNSVDLMTDPDLRRAWQEGQANLSVPDAIAYVDRVLGVRRRFCDPTQEARLAAISALDEFSELCRSFHHKAENKSIQAFLTEIALLKSKGDASSYEKEDPERVKLPTVHAAKGTEYPIVVLIGLEEGIFHDYRAVKEKQRGNPRPMEEERRSCFVAVTRTMQELILVHTCHRPDRSGFRLRDPSRFLLEMGPEIDLEFDP